MLYFKTGMEGIIEIIRDLPIMHSHNNVIDRGCPEWSGVPFSDMV